VIDVTLRNHGGTQTMFTPLGLDHVVLRVRDQAASQKFYTEVLGCTLDHVNERISLVQLRFGEQLIDLLPATRPVTEPGSGMDHFCLSIRCDDLGAVGQALRARGVEVLGDVVDRRGAYGTGPSLYIHDPDGYTLELKPRAASPPVGRAGEDR
jgi:glyoxylase I family protein